MTSAYDRIGIDYSRLRRPDERIARQIEAVLGDAKTVLNVGAGTGSYEPADRKVVAVEPSLEMIRQRADSAAPVVRAIAEALPFADRAFDAAMAILTIHHWSDQAKGLREMRRVARGPVVLLTYDPSFRNYWLADYVPELVSLDEAQMPTLANYEKSLGPVDIEPVPIPHDCTDGFLHAYWRRPEAYLNPRMRTGSSSFWKIDDIDEKLAALERDLASGAWEQRYGDILSLDARDMGYRLVVTK